MEESGYFRGADGSAMFSDYVIKSHNQMKTGKDLENIMIKFVNREGSLQRG